MDTTPKHSETLRTMLLLQGYAAICPPSRDAYVFAVSQAHGIAEDSVTPDQRDFAEGLVSLLKDCDLPQLFPTGVGLCCAHGCGTTLHRWEQQDWVCTACNRGGE